MAVDRASDNPFPSILMVEGDPEDLASNPTTGQRRLAVGTDHILYLVDDSGVKHAIGAVPTADDVSVTPFGSIAATNVQDALEEIVAEVSGGMTDPMTTAGDIIYRNGSNTTARLAKGAAGGMLSQYNGDIAWNSGTSFPASPASGNRYWRSDLNREFYYDGTRWVSSELFSDTLDRIDGNTHIISATSSAGWWWGLPNNGGVDIWVVSVEAAFIVASGGSALSGSHKWVGTLDRANAGTNIATMNIDSGASNSYRNVSTSVGAAVANGQIFGILTWTKTGSPGNLTAMTRANYRLIAT